jgi:hypothetical protein
MVGLSNSSLEVGNVLLEEVTLEELALDELMLDELALELGEMVVVLLEELLPDE